MSGGSDDLRGGSGPDFVAGDAAEVVRPFLDRGEEVLWAGQPDPGVHFSKADFYLVPFSVLTLAVGLIWASTLGLVGWIFALFGAYAVFGRFMWKARRKRVTYYAVTEKRIVRVSGTKGKAQPFDEIPNAQLYLRKSGNGTIRFSNRPGYAAVYQNSGMEWVSFFGNPDEIAFHDIPDAQSVHDLVIDRVWRSQGLTPPSETDAEGEEDGTGSS